MKPMNDKPCDVIAKCYSIANLQCLFQKVFWHEQFMYVTGNVWIHMHNNVRLINRSNSYLQID